MADVLEADFAPAGPILVGLCIVEWIMAEVIGIKHNVGRVDGYKCPSFGAEITQGI